MLFMATLGVAYFLDGFGQTVWGSDIYTLNVGMPKEPMILFESTFEGGILVSMEDVYRGADRGDPGGAAGALLPEDRHRPGAARGGRRPPGGAVDRHPAEPHLGHRLERGRAGGAGGRRDLGLEARRAVLAAAGGAEGAAGGDPRRLHLDSRAPSSAGSSSAWARRSPRCTSGPMLGGGHRELVRLRAGAGLPAVPARRPFRRDGTSTGSDALPSCHDLPRNRPVQDDLRVGPAALPDPAGPRLRDRLPGVRVRRDALHRLASTCSARS